MPTYKAPLRDMRFVINEVFNAEEHLYQLPAFSEVSDDLVDAVLEEAAKIAETLLLPLNQTGDQQGCQFHNGTVSTPKGFKAAYKTFAEGGWTSLTADPEYGGQGFPQMVNVLIEEMLCSSNVAFSLYPGLSHGAYYCIHSHANDELKQTYLPKIVDGTWAGVMCLTEAHCGTDLGLLRTKAIPQTNGSYKLTGSKIFITGGEQDLTENIIHMVLARTPDAPAGVKGISLFLVPKFLVKDDGSLGARNGVHCGSIEHKMGIKGSSTCVMNYEDATGFLIGELNQGLSAMFTMMNTERLAIGLEGLGLAEIAYQNAATYAKERRQGRAADDTEASASNADPIIVHPDVRRMLLTMKALNEGARALASWVAMQVDYSKYHTDETTRNQAEACIALLTPVVKAFFSDYGFDACNLGLQVYGGHGYVAEWGMEQFVRDARIAQIYEGANGIQALDLTRRKLIASKGKLLESFITPVQTFLIANRDDAELAAFIQPLDGALQDLQTVSQWLLKAADSDPNAAGAASNDYLHLLGLVSLAFMWAQMAKVAQQQLANDNDGFYTAKLQTARFFMQRLLPRTKALAASLQSGSDVLMALDERAF